MTKIDITKEDLSIVAGPAYEQQSEDGPIAVYDWFIVYRDRQEGALTWKESFQRDYQTKEILEQIVAQGSIDPEKWDKGDPWFFYHKGKPLKERWAPFGDAWEQDQKERE